MKHTTKTRLFKTLALLPNRVGYPLYYSLQSIGSKLTLEYKIQQTKNSYETVLKIFRENNIGLEGKKVAEIGSGWVPVFPYLLVLEGKVKHVDTYDINEHYNQKQINKVNDYFANKHNITVRIQGKYSLLKQVTYFPKVSISNGELEETDLVISRFVLEHIPPDTIAEIHNDLFAKLKSGSYVLHLISPSDHRAYSDSSLSLQDFLKYSKEEWNQIQTKFDYHNRLRLPQYLELLKRDFEIIYFEHDKMNKESNVYKKFKKLKIHNDFKNFTDQELMAGSVNILLKRK